MTEGMGFWPLKARWGDGTCPVCGAEFAKLAPRQKYCTVQHEVDARNRRHGEQIKARRKKREMANA